MDIHEKFMQRAIEIAHLGLGNVQPNPLVGCVIVHQNKIIAEGYHQFYGQAHAEVNAINDALNKYPNAVDVLQSSTLYVNLEPCSHYGKTPPCADLIIKYKIPKVVISNVDPFHSVNGKGIEKLKAAGIEVITGVLSEQGKDLNKRFLTYHLLQRPYVILKWAESKDSFISLEENKRTNISGAEAQKINHKWRSEEQSILVGTKTVLVDNPFLTVRNVEGKNPIRVIIDKDLKLNRDLHIFNEDSKTIVFNNKKTFSDGNIQFIQIDFYGLVPQFILYQLYLMEIQSIIVEGGSFTINEFIQFDLWDEARILRSRENFQQGVAAPKVHGKTISKTEIANDELIIIKRI